VAANNGKGKGFWLQDREAAQVVRRSGQGVQDKTEQDRSDLQGRSARFILAKQATDPPTLRTSGKIGRSRDQIGPIPTQDRRKTTIC
ncbi:hypothetical protein ABG067_008555, partial [Albugo candida]